MRNLGTGRDGKLKNEIEFSSSHRCGVSGTYVPVWRFGVSFLVPEQRFRYWCGVSLTVLFIEDGNS